MTSRTPPGSALAAFNALPAPRRVVAAAAFAAAFERATAEDAETLPLHELLTLASAAGWAAARRAQNDEAGQGAGYCNDLIRGALYHAWLAAADHRRGLVVMAEPVEIVSNPHSAALAA